MTNNHTINEKAFQEAYKAAKVKASRLPNAISSYLYEEDELDWLKENVYRTFLETYFEFIDRKG